MCLCAEIFKVKGVASFSEPALPLWDSLKLIFTSLICMTVASVVVFFVRRSAKKDNSVF